MEYVSSKGDCKSLKQKPETEEKCDVRAPACVCVSVSMCHII